MKALLVDLEQGCRLGLEILVQIDADGHAGDPAHPRHQLREFGTEFLEDRFFLLDVPMMTDEGFWDIAVGDLGRKYIDELKSAYLGQRHGWNLEELDTAIHSLTAAHAIPLNTVGGAVQLTTGRRLRADGWPGDADSVAVFLDGGCAFDSVPPQGLHIYWGAYLGMAQQICIDDPVTDVADEIKQVRAEARARHGWIMDVYLLRRKREGSKAHEV